MVIEEYKERHSPIEAWARIKRFMRHRGVVAEFLIRGTLLYVAGIAIFGFVLSFGSIVGMSIYAMVAAVNLLVFFKTV